MLFRGSRRTRNNANRYLSNTLLNPLWLSLYLFLYPSEQFFPDGVRQVVRNLQHAHQPLFRQVGPH